MRYLHAVTAFFWAFFGTFLITMFISILPVYVGRQELLTSRQITLIVLPTAVIAGVLAARRVYKRNLRLAPVWHVLALMLVVSLVVGLIIPTGCGQPAEPAHRAVCRSNLKQIGLALSIYAKDFENHLPRRLEELYPNYINDQALFECPSAPDPQSYVYVPGLVADGDASRIVAFDRKGNHEDGRNVLFADGKVRWMSENGFSITLGQQPNAKQVRALDSAHAPVR